MTFFQITRTGRSLIFVRTTTMNQRVCDYLRECGVPFISTEREATPIRAALAFDSLQPNLALVTTLPTFATGIRIRADQIIWIGELKKEVVEAALEGATYDPDVAVYLKAIERCQPGTPVHHFAEHVI